MCKLVLVSLQFPLGYYLRIVGLFKLLWNAHYECMYVGVWESSHAACVWKTALSLSYSTALKTAPFSCSAQSRSWQECRHEHTHKLLEGVMTRFRCQQEAKLHPRGKINVNPNTQVSQRGDICFSLRCFSGWIWTHASLHLCERAGVTFCPHTHLICSRLAHITLTVDVVTI